ncbi:MAG: hypothetical protein SGILL_004124 [Bacillariaceae sp.]
MNRPTMSPQHSLLEEIQQVALAENTATSAVAASATLFSTVKTSNQTKEEPEEEIPMKRAVRMVVGLSVSSDASDPAAAASATADMEPPMKWRQESATSTSTASTERTSVHSESQIGGSDPFSESLASDVHVELIEEGREVVVAHDEQHHTMESNNEVEDDDLSGSGIYSLQKLYGRQQEEEMLASAYERIVQQNTPRMQPEYVLISGGVGSGKTVLSDTLRRKVKSGGGYFCVGTFDQMGQRGPVQPLVDSFAEYVQQVFDYGDEEVKIAQRRIRSIVGVNELPFLMRIVPALKSLLNGDDDALDNAPLNAHDCGCNGEKNDVTKGTHSNLAMGRLMRAISRPERPVVMMLDDLQWASGCAFEKLQNIVIDDMNDSFMFLGVTRNDVSATSYISGFLRNIEDRSVRITNIELSNFNLQDVQEMVNDSFAMPPEQSSALAEFMHLSSSGNPFFVSSSISMLQHQPRFLNFDKEAGKWSINTEVAEPYMSTCPIDLVAKKLEVYPRGQKKVLMVVACLGSHSTQTMIEAALQEDASESLEHLVSKSKLVFDEKEKTYTIRFNAVKTAAYNLIGEELQPAFHLEIGLRLMQFLDPQELDEKLFCVAMQLKNGLELLQDQEKKYEVAALFVRVAEKTAETFSFNATLWALRLAHSLLGPNHWEDAYELSVVIYNYLAEIEFALDDSEHVDVLLDEINENARSCSDGLQSFTTRVHVLGVRGKPDAAIDKGICILRHLGVNLNTDLRRLNLMWSMGKIGRKVRGKSNEMLRRLPEMSDPKQLTAMQVLNLLFLNTFLHRRELFPFVVLKMMKMSLRFGLSSMSSVAFAGYGTLLAFCGHGNEAQRFGKVALDLVDRFDASSFRSRVYGLVYGLINPAVHPWRDSLDFLKQGHELGMLTGDAEFAMLNAHLHVGFMMDDGGFTVEEMISALKDCVDMTNTQGKSQHVKLSPMEPIRRAFLEYNDPSGDITQDFDFLEEACKAVTASGNAMLVCMTYYTRIYGLFSARKYQKALEVLNEKNAICPPMGGSMLDSFEMYMEGMVVFACARQETNGAIRKSLVQRGRKAMKALQKLSVQNPDNCLGKFTLLEAEYAALCKKDSLAKLKYSQAMALSTGHNNNSESVFSKQAAGMHYVVDLQDPQTGLKYLEESIDVLNEFGGHAAATFWEGIVSDIKDKGRFSVI